MSHAPCRAEIIGLTCFPMNRNGVQKSRDDLDGSGRSMPPITTHGHTIGAVDGIHLGSAKPVADINVPLCAVWPAMVVESAAVIPVVSSNFQYPTSPVSVPVSVWCIVLVMSAAVRAMLQTRNSSMLPLK